MAFEIIWSPKAEQRFSAVIDYLSVNFTERDVKNFIIKVDKVLSLIKKNPNLYKTSFSRKHIKEAVVTKHNVLNL